MGTPSQDAIAIIRSHAASEESYYLEFKSGWQYGPDGRTPRQVKDIATDIGEAIVAFANSDGGDLVVGLEDDGSITGLPHGSEQLLYLQAWRQQVQLLPPTDNATHEPSVRVLKAEVDGAIVLLFRVEAHGGPAYVTSGGRCLMRQGPRSVPASADKIQRRRAHQRGDLDYETQPAPTADLHDLDWPLIRDSIRAPALQQLDDIALLRYWNLIEQRNGSVVLRTAALLLFAKNALRWHPNNRIRVRRVLGSDEGFGRDLNTTEREFVGPAVSQLAEVTQLLHRTLEREARGDQLFSTQHLLPRQAIDECIVNAVAHRNYAIDGQAIEVLIFPDRVEFRSPGQLPEPITVQQLRERLGVHRSRNPVIMRVLRDLGWTRDQGEGMRRIFGSMRQVELHEPELEETGDTFVVRLSTRSVYDEQTQAWIAAFGPFGLRPDERRYLVELRRSRNNRLSVDKLARQLGESYDETRAALQTLEQRGIVWHAPKSRTYRLVEPFNVPHERTFRRFSEHHTVIDDTTQFDRTHLARVLRLGDDQAALSAAIDRLKQQGAIQPVKAGRWKFGTSFLAYVQQRRRE